jgi:hypothetical protein
MSIDLERRVLDPEPIVQHDLQVLPRVVAVVFGPRQAGRDDSRGARQSYCIVGPDGGFDWTAPDEEVFRFNIDKI